MTNKNTLRNLHKHADLQHHTDWVAKTPVTQCEHHSVTTEVCGTSTVSV
ncbi:MAG: hypothetical protein R3C01_12310 [Planctomycetaceae bacterium]